MRITVSVVDDCPVGWCGESSVPRRRAPLYRRSIVNSRIVTVLRRVVTMLMSMPVGAPVFPVACLHPMAVRVFMNVLARASRVAPAIHTVNALRSPYPSGVVVTVVAALWNAWPTVGALSSALPLSRCSD